MKKLDTLIIGAGFSGVCAAIKLREKGITDFRVIEKHDGIGGTWYANTYPGAACDVPSHFYSFSFEPNPNWSRLYSPQPEIQQYIEHCVDKYGLRPHIDFGTEVTAMTYDDENRGWTITFAKGDPVFARFVINGMGGLHRPAWPDIEGRGSFQGETMHTAVWNNDFDCTGKRIAVIGNAASGIQVIPQLAKIAARLDVYQRTPNFIAPRKDVAYTDRQKRAFARYPAWQRFYRWVIKRRMDNVLYPVIRDADKRKKMGGLVKKYMRAVVQDETLRDKLEPKFEIGCKRILISDDFYPSLNRDNVDVLTDGITRITETGVVDGTGVEREVDAIVYATGFDVQTQFFAVELTGADGLTLREAWKDGAQAYRGIMVSGFPNYFQTTGPNTGVGTTSVVFMIEKTVDWIMRAMDKVRGGGTIDVKPEAQAAYNRKIHQELAGTVWATGCQSWYKTADGRIETLYPGNATAFDKEMKKLVMDDLKIAS